MDRNRQSLFKTPRASHWIEKYCTEEGKKQLIDLLQKKENEAIDKFLQSDEGVVAYKLYQLAGPA